MRTSKELEDYVINCGYEYTDNIFLVPDNLYLSVLETKQYVTKHPHEVIVHRTVTRNRYMCWNYSTMLKNEISFDTYKTQLSLFKYMIEDEDFLQVMLSEIIEHDLSQIVSQSALLFNR